MRERIVLQTASPVAQLYRTSGTLEEWQSQVAAYAAGNSRAVLAIAAALAGPLLRPLNLESGGFHLIGKSSGGKSTFLMTSASVYGYAGAAQEEYGFVETWQATINGLAGVAMNHSDTFLPLDEIGLARPDEVGQAAYLLASGKEKARSDRHGDAKASRIWRTIFLSTGEISVAQKAAEAGLETTAGQGVRIVDIPADPGAGLGLFENLHGFRSSALLVEHLKQATSRYYGQAGRRFLADLVSKLEWNLEKARFSIRLFRNEHCPADADGQIGRVCDRFGLVAAAGELAIDMGILPWRIDEAHDAAAQCFRAWLQERGGCAPAEELSALARVRRFIEAHAASRFQPLGDLDAGPENETRIVNRAGFVRRLENDGGREYLILPETWKREVCGPHNPREVADLLVELGFLKVDSEGKAASKARVPGFPNSIRCYVISSDILGSDEAEEPTGELAAQP